MNNKKKNKVVIKESQLRSMIQECLKKKMHLNEERGEFNINIGTGGGYYGGSSIFSYDGETYSFHPSGWDFNTDSQMEAAAVMSSSDKSFWDDDQLYEIPIDDNLTEYDLECGAYWMTGGNVMWRFGGDENLTVGWNEAKEQVTDACRDHLMECWRSSSNFHDLIANLVAKKEDFIYDLYDDCCDLFEYEDDEDYNEETTDNEQINESRKMRSIIRESVRKALNEERGFKFKECDEVIIHHPKKGDMKGKIENYDYNIMSWKPEYTVELENGRTLMGVPENCIELVNASSDEDYRNKMQSNKLINSMLQESWEEDEEYEEEDRPVPYEEWNRYLNGKTPLFEFEDGITYVDYDENGGTLCSGGVTNVGFHKDGEVEVPVYDGDFQSALEEVYSQLCCKHEPLD